MAANVTAEYEFWTNFSLRLFGPASGSKSGVIVHSESQSSEVRGLTQQ